MSQGSGHSPSLFIFFFGGLGELLPHFLFRYYIIATALSFPLGCSSISALGQPCSGLLWCLLPAFLESKSCICFMRTAIHLPGWFCPTCCFSLEEASTSLSPTVISSPAAPHSFCSELHPVLPNFQPSLCHFLSRWEAERPGPWQTALRGQRSTSHMGTEIQVSRRC